MLVLLVLMTLLAFFAPSRRSIRCSTSRRSKPLRHPLPGRLPTSPPCSEPRSTRAMADGKTLAEELARLQAELERSKVASCRPIERPKPPALPVDRWAKKGPGLFSRGAGCWVTTSSRLARRHRLPWARSQLHDQGHAGCASTPMGREKIEATTVCPIAGTISCPSEIQRNSRMMERSRQRCRQRNANEVLRPVRYVNGLMQARRIHSHAMCRITGFSQSGAPGTGRNEAEFRREQ